MNSFTYFITSTIKVAPVHVMEAYWDSGGTSVTVLILNVTTGKWSASCPGRFTTGKEWPVGFRPGLEICRTQNVLLLTFKQRPRLFSLTVSGPTACTTPLHRNHDYSNCYCASVSPSLLPLLFRDHSPQTLRAAGHVGCSVSVKSGAICVAQRFV